MSTKSNILVTGCSSGFGLLITRTLLREGHTVFATMRAPGGRNAAIAEELTAFGGESPGTVHVLEMDVTEENSVQHAVTAAHNIAGGLDVVVNNAGIGCGGFAEAFTVEQYQQIFDINVFGVQRVNRAVLPSMRAAGKGLLLFVSSVMGRVVIPFGGPYTATKYALEGLVESYRYELAGTGVDVATVEPGGFLTGFADRLMTPGDPERQASYGPLAELPEKMWGGFIEQLGSGGAPDPQEVAAAVSELIGTPAGQRPLRTVVDPMMGGEGPRALNRASDEIQAHLLGELGMAAFRSVR